MSKPTVYIINAAAGHGKDYTKDLIEDILKIETIKLHFAQKAKEIIAKGIFRESGTLEDKVDKLNDYKDNKLDTPVIGEANMRRTLQVILGDVIRNINPEIHALFVLKKIEKNLLNGEDTTFVCTDNRYKNEQELLYPINLLQTKETKIDYIRWQIQENKTKINDIQILEKFENLTKDLIKTQKDSNTLNKIKLSFLKENQEISETQKPNQDFNEFFNDIDFKKIGVLSKEEGLEKGLINVFRPLLDPEMTKFKDIDYSIIEYNKITKEELEQIKENYKRFNIDFEIENIKKYGFLRAYWNHLSETDLNGRKPEAFLNIPNWNERDLKTRLTELLLGEKPQIKKNKTLRMN